MINHNGSMFIKKLKNVTAVRLIVSSFLFIVLIGAIILCFPICSRDHRFTNFVDALFTATSATCVTGLSVFDTFTHWNFFGQVIVILLIQIGGLGIISFTTGATLLIRGKLDFRDLQIAKEHTNGKVVDVYRLITTILLWTFICEGTGALLLSLRFVPDFGLRGLWMAVFTSISAYCNAGFDIMGFISPGTSFISYNKDIFVSLVISFLIVFGGLGFIVINDVGVCISKKFKNRKLKPRLKLHSFLVIMVTIFFLLIGTALFLIFEYNNTLFGMTFSQKLSASFFQSASTRTAGFFSLPISDQNNSTKILSIVLMFIGASPSSTGGGIKTTTFLVMLITIFSVLRGREDAIVLRHKVEKSTVYKALTIIILFLFLVSLFTVILSFIENSQSNLSLIYEVVSAFSTTGLSVGITSSLKDISKILLSIAMFIGRVGPISLVLSVTLHQKEKVSDKILPEAKILVG